MTTDNPPPPARPQSFGTEERVGKSALDAIQQGAQIIGELGGGAAGFATAGKIVAGAFHGSKPADPPAAQSNAGQE
jgi:hypothetical protein